MTNLIKSISLSLLMGSTFLTTAMDSKNCEPTESKQRIVKRECNLTETIELFENRYWKEAYKNFKRIGNAGGIVGSAYITYMEEKEHVDPTIVHDHVVIEPIPQIGQDLSRQYLNASLAYMEPDIASKVKKLAPLVLNHNAHAISLMYKLCKANDAAFKLLIKENGFNGKKYKSSIDLFHNFKPSDTPQNCWNCLDPDYLVYLHYNRPTSTVAKLFTATELKYFTENYEKKPSWLGKLATKLASSHDSKTVSQPLFWAHLALENGAGDFCGQLGKSLYDHSRMVKVNSTQHKKIQNNPQSTNAVLTSQQRHNLELSRYYVSHIQTGDLLDFKEVSRLIQHYGGAYQKGTYGKQDKLKGFLFDQKAADLGAAESQYDVAVMFRDGNGVERNPRKALYYFKLAAAQNNTDAQFNIGALYANGDGIEVDNEVALHYFQLAEKNGDLEAREQVIQLLSKIEKDIDSLRNYADQGNPVAQLKLGEWLIKMAANAQSLPESDKYLEEARQYIELSAAQGNKFALNQLGIMLYEGIRGQPDWPRARKCFQEAADQGLADAQHNFAAMAYLGQGGDKDVKVAEENYQKSANKGNIDSILSLKALLEETSLGKLEIKEEPSAEEDVEIVLPPLQGSNEGDFIDKVGDDLIPLEPSSKIETEALVSAPMINSEIEETKRLIEKHDQEIRELRAKKQAQKRAAELSKQTLRMKGKVYQEMKLHGIKNAQTHTKKPKVAHGTLEFVKTIFSVKGAQKINAFSIHAARKAFADIGCVVSNKKGENSTKLKFNLEGKGIMKFKFHNPHELGEDLYDALKPYMKRFLESINKTPETVG